MQHRILGVAARTVTAALTAMLMTLAIPTAGIAAGPSALDEFLAAHPEAVQISPAAVAWDDGAVVLVFPDRSNSLAGASPLDHEPAAAATAPSPDKQAAEPRAVALATVNGCPSGWSCLYENSNFAGRRLQFQDCGYRQSLADYGFNDQATSWVNNRSRITNVWENVGGFGIIWTEAANSKSSNVGSADNDRASSISLDC